MNKKIISDHNTAIIESQTPIITGGQSMLDLLADIYYNNDCTNLAINKEAFDESFFVLSSGVAGEVLQKVINYSMKLAIFGDFSQYTSKPLKDFIYECNKGRSIFFVDTEQQAIDRLMP